MAKVARRKEIRTLERKEARRKGELDKDWKRKQKPERREIGAVVADSC